MLFLSSSITKPLVLLHRSLWSDSWGSALIFSMFYQLLLWGFICYHFSMTLSALWEHPHISLLFHVGTESLKASSLFSIWIGLLAWKFSRNLQASEERKLKYSWTWRAGPPKVWPLWIMMSSSVLQRSAAPAHRCRLPPGAWIGVRKWLLKQDWN